MSTPAGGQAVPAGWYPNVQSPGHLRYWDGNAWTDLNALGTPTSGIPPSYATSNAVARAEPVTVDNAFAWTLAFAPLILIVLERTLTGAGGTSQALSFVMAITVNIVLATADSQRLRAVGVNLPWLFALFLVPVYLFQRSMKLRQSYAIPIIWCLCFLISLGGTGLFTSNASAESQSTTAIGHTSVSAPADQLDAKFVVTVTAGTTSYSGRSNDWLIAEGHKACGYLGYLTLQAVFVYIVDDNGGQGSSYDAGYLTGAAISNYCPQYSNLFSP